MTAPDGTSAATYRLGVDVGGTFTDMLLMDAAENRVFALKTPTTPDPEDAVINGLGVFEDRDGVNPAEIGYVSHGTTIAVNTLLERTGEPVGVLITEGFLDTLELRRLRLSKPNDLFVPKPVSLVPRRHVLEIAERLDGFGAVLEPIDRAEVEKKATALYDEGIRNIAVCFLHAFRNPDHEARAKAWIAALYADVYVCTSAEIWPQQREYERFLISVINSYVGARMKRYFSTLRDKIAALGLSARVFSTKSNGGVMSLEAAADRPVQTMLSGPASGVIGAVHTGRQIGEDKLVTLDMGGTSVDIAIINGEIPYSTENTVGDFPVIMPAVDVSAIGAGGGSIAWIDPEGVLKVGPQSAGATPGPAAYARGGTDATVTDAYLTVGICSPDAFLGGEMTVDAALGCAAIERLARTLGMDATETADAILRVASANIYAGLIPHLARRGVDASDFSLLAYGAAGPTHSFLVAREIGFKRVIVPPTPGLLCALGCLVADLRNDFVATVWRDLDEIGDDELRAMYANQHAQGMAWLEREGVRLDRLFVLRSADMCYVGQSFEITVTFPIEGDDFTTADLAEWFHAQHRKVFGHADPEAPVRLIDARTQVVGEMPKPQVRSIQAGAAAGAASAPWRKVYDRGHEHDVVVTHRSALELGQSIAGPLIVEQYDTTIYIPEGFVVTVDDHLNLIGETA